ncbi:MAG: preprotein translocase subunit SecA [Anaerolineae bacterium]|jgi:preprotein translocase subunit SecA|nr:preprotein translocase subunit SecA [Anaerolineae bacterium]
MLRGLLSKIVGDANERELKRLQPVVEQINALEPAFEALSNEQLRDKTQEFIGRLHAGETLDDILPEAYAAVREASKRTIGLRHFDVQLIGGIVLHQGKVAEMATGEGKTLVATLPLYLNALEGKGAHLVTVNDYLAKRDAQWMGPIYHLLGLSVGVIQHDAAFLYDPDYVADDDRYQHLRPVSRREAYLADITYGTNHEFGFDYLRDNMVTDLSQCVQRELHYAIVDEVDYILIDEARTPLIISGQAEEPDPNYERMARLIPRLRAEEDYVVDEKARVVTLTEQGLERLEKWLGVDNLYSPENSALTPYVDNALRAHVLFHRDHNYVVLDNQVIIVDEFTGRLMHGRRYSEGLHQAIEAKEGVPIQRENLTLATITLQNYFRMYEKLAGMTGTAATEAEELHKIYGLDVTVIPTNKPVIRKDYPDVVYKNQQAKFRAVVQEIKELYQRGQPVLVGTVAIETSEMLSEMLRREGIPHQVLNAKHHEREAAIIAQAGRSGAVTIATNMAGRGVDIKLGGDPEGLARETLRRKGVDLTTVDPQTWQAALEEAKRICEEDQKKVLALGGLHVLGTERHEARRIDNQLRGRSGRQGDPGSSRFYLSLEDDLMRRFGGQAVANLMERLGVEEDMPIEHGLISKTIENAQMKVEGYNFDIRKHVLEYDDVVNQQRSIIYEQRRKVLSEPTLKPVVMQMIGDEVRGLIAQYTAADRDEWDLDGLYNSLAAFIPMREGRSPTVARWRGLKPQAIESEMIARAEEVYDEAQKMIGRDLFQQAMQSGLRLADLANAEGGVFRLLYEALPAQVSEKTWQAVQSWHLDRLDKAAREEIADAFGRIITLYRDRQVMLHTVDNLWIRHLTDLDNLREGIGLRAYGQQDPLIAYKVEAYDMYQDLMTSIQHEVAQNILRPVTIRQRQPLPVMREMRTNINGDTPTRRPAQTGKPRELPGRNDPCWCGSGKKYKHCHMNQDQASVQGKVGSTARLPMQTTRPAKAKKNKKRGRR